MSNAKAFAAQNATTPLGPFSLSRREPGAKDVQMQILYCGVCHTDIHFARNEWGVTVYPVVPGGEKTLRNLVRELMASNRVIRERVRYQLRGSYTHYYRLGCLVFSG